MEEAAAEALIAHVKLSGNGYTTVSPDTHEIPAQLTPVLSRGLAPSKTLMIFPDSGAGVCLGGPQHSTMLGLKPSELIPCQKKVRAVGGSTLTCHGWLPVKFGIGTMSLSNLYISVIRLTGCISVVQDAQPLRSSHHLFHIPWIIIMLIVSMPL